AAALAVRRDGRGARVRAVPAGDRLPGALDEPVVDPAREGGPARAVVRARERGRARVPVAAHCAAGGGAAAARAAAARARRRAVEGRNGVSHEEKRVEKPWGYEIWWARTERYVGKLLHVNKGQSLSLQYHNVKDETIRILSGKLLFETKPKDAPGEMRR